MRKHFFLRQNTHQIFFYNLITAELHFYTIALTARIVIKQIE